MSSTCGAHTFPYIEASNPTAQIEHEATTSKMEKTKSSTANNEALMKRRQLDLSKRICERSPQ